MFSSGSSLRIILTQQELTWHIFAAFGLLVLDLLTLHAILAPLVTSVRRVPSSVTHVLSITLVITLKLLNVRSVLTMNIPMDFGVLVSPKSFVLKGISQKRTPSVRITSERKRMYPISHRSATTLNLPFLMITKPKSSVRGVIPANSDPQKGSLCVLLVQPVCSLRQELRQNVSPVDLAPWLKRGCSTQGLMITLKCLKSPQAVLATARPLDFVS
mmetsp:Transcript_20330/g.28057  ORF Transcript_20330/g.28057 Transcript_20330/m.28057 type:complete len:215 (+) Transcript_20330:1207-1851(+)